MKSTNYSYKMWALSDKDTGNWYGWKGFAFVFHSREDARSEKRMIHSSESYKVEKVLVTIERVNAYA